MTDLGRPTVRSRHLGMRLRTLREERGLTIQQAARRLNRSPSSLSRLETGARGIRRPALENMLDRYGVTEDHTRESLFALAVNARKRGWWQRYEGKLSPDALDYISLESEATSIQEFQLHLVPGLLQTESYARAMIASWIPLGRPYDVNGLTEIRMRRQQMLLRPNGPHLWAIVSEAALRQNVGGVEIMQGQLKKLAGICGSPDMTLQVLPFSTGTHPGHNGSFITLTTGDLSVVLVENLYTGWYLEELEEVRQYSLVFDHLRALALSAEDSQSLIEGILSEA